MKRILIFAALMAAAVSCNKRTLDEPAAPSMPDLTQPIQFGTGAPDAELTKANITLGDGLNGTLKMDKLGIFAFLSNTVPTSAATATTALWYNSENTKTANVSYAFFDDHLGTSTSKYYREEVAAGAKPLLFWPASGGGRTLTFLGYFPGIASGTAMPAAPNQLAYVDNSAFELKADLSDQTIQTGKAAVHDYGFAWAKPLEGVARTEPVTRQKLEFTYKVAKLSLVIKSDGEDPDGVTVSAGGPTDKGLKAVRVYSKNSGLHSDYTLNLLTGVPAAGTTVADSLHAIKVQPVNNPGDPTATPNPVLPYITATAYLVPATAAALNSAADVKDNGIVVQVIYNDGTKDESYVATINTTTVTNPATGGKPDLTDGLEAAKNYKYTVKFGKAGLTFTGQVVDWVDADPIPDIDLD